MVLGGTCSVSADCSAGSVTNANCDSGTSTCVCDTGYTANAGSTACTRK